MNQGDYFSSRRSRQFPSTATWNEKWALYDLPLILTEGQGRRSEE